MQFFKIYIDMCNQVQCISKIMQLILQIHIYTTQPQVHTIRMTMPLLRHLVPSSHPGGLGSIPGQTSKICSGQCGSGMGFTLNTCFSLPQSFHQFSILEFICLPSRYIGLVMDSVMKQKEEIPYFVVF